MRRLELRTVSTRAGRDMKVEALLVAHMPAWSLAKSLLQVTGW